VGTATVLLWLAALAFLLQCVAAYAPTEGRLGRVPWLAVGLLLAAFAALALLGHLDLDL
jgi:hypothetical protein